MISAFVFATQIEQFLFYLNPKFQASSHLLLLYSLVCVGPGRNPEDRFSHNEAHVVYRIDPSSVCLSMMLTFFNLNQFGERTGLVVRASDSELGDPGSILGRVGVLFP